MCKLNNFHRQGSGSEMTCQAGSEMTCQAGFEMTCQAGFEMTCQAGFEMTCLPGRIRNDLPVRIRNCLLGRIRNDLPGRIQIWNDPPGRIRIEMTRKVGSRSKLEINSFGSATLLTWIRNKSWSFFWDLNCFSSKTSLSLLPMKWICVKIFFTYKMLMLVNSMSCEFFIPSQDLYPLSITLKIQDQNPALKVPVVLGQTNWGSKVGSIDRYLYWTVALYVFKKFGGWFPPPIQSNSVSAHSCTIT